LSLICSSRDLDYQIVPAGACGSCSRPVVVNNRLYHLVAINERSGREFQVTAVPLQHSNACTLMGKFTVHAARRLELKEAQGK
jgi:hypothetical protein